MSPSHICQACRRRLAQIRPQRPPQWHQRVSFISLSKNGARTTTDGKTKTNDDLLNLGDDVGKGKGRHAALPDRTQRMPQIRNQGDLLESLFEQSITEAAIAEKRIPQAISSLEPYKKAEALKKMMGDSSPPADSFYFFVDHFGPNAGHSMLKSTSPSYLRSTAKNLLRSIIVEKQRDPFSSTLPSVTEVSSVFLRLRMLTAGEWVDLMTPLIHNIIDLMKETVPDVTHEQRLFSDLLGSWNVVCRSPGDFEDIPEHSSSELNWSHIPAVTTKDALHIYRKSGPLVTFGILTPPFSIRQLARIPPLVLSTFQILNSKPSTIQNILGNSERFISALSLIISVPGLNIHSQDIIGQDAVIAPFIEKHLPVMKVLASPATNPEVEQSAPRNFADSRTGYNVGLSFINKRLHEALKSKNRHQVDELWADVVRWPIAVNQIKEEGTLSQRGTLSAPLCNYFILVYMSLRQPNRAIDVWNHMVQNRMTPTLETWDSMMSGCKVAKDPVALEGVWRKMQAANVQPDIYCWTTRISGLMACHKLDAAIHALDEMGRRWLEAAKAEYPKMSLEKLQKMDRIKGAVKPTIETVNAAIVGALRQQRKEYASQILAWAGNYGITPDVKTYNILLMPLLRAGQTQQAMALLQQMRNSGIEADEGTYTTVLDETFRFVEDLSPEEQQEVVFGIFDEMEQAGLKANLHTFGKIIYALLQNSSGDMTVVNIVLERMAKLNLEPSTHIYTILVQHYFNQDPPQLDAVRSTIERARMGTGTTDAIFWDRVVEGYSRAGETAAALRIVGKVNKTDSRIGWLALKELLNALARNEEWDMAKALVRDQIVETGGPLSRDVKGKEGQHLFWKVAMDLELLDVEKRGDR